jgi:probable rRNA maturation factor
VSRTISVRSTPTARAALKRAGLDGRRAAALVRRGAAAALRDAEPDVGSLSIALLDDAGIARLNREYLEHDGPTDVLAFPLWAPGEPLVGDVYIGAARAVAQAAALAVPLEEELVRLAVHGTLHVLGWDHPAGAQRVRSAMWRTQERLVAEVLAS